MNRIEKLLNDTKEEEEEEDSRDNEEGYESNPENDVHERTDLVNLIIERINRGSSYVLVKNVGYQYNLHQVTREIYDWRYNQDLNFNLVECDNANNLTPQIINSTILQHHDQHYHNQSIENMVRCLGESLKEPSYQGNIPGDLLGARLIRQAKSQMKLNDHIQNCFEITCEKLNINNIVHGIVFQCLTSEIFSNIRKLTSDYYTPVIFSRIGSDVGHTPYTHTIRLGNQQH